MLRCRINRMGRRDVKILGRGLLVLLGLIAFLAILGNTTKDEMRAPERYAATASQSPPPPAEPRPVARIKLAKSNWSREGFGNVAQFNFWIENGNDYAVRDVTVECDFHGSSGTRLHSKTETLFHNFPAKKTTHIPKINLGFIDQQVKTAGCEVVGALRK